MRDTRPIHYFQWHITHICNLRCTHCYQEDYCQHTPEDELFRTLDLYSEFIAGKNLQPQINLTGGEPLMHPVFFRLAEEIRRRGYRLGILTNGTLIDDAVAFRIAALHPVFVQISIDGTREIHDGIRGAGNFDKAMAGIDFLKKHGVKVLVSFTAQKKNYFCFAELAEICRAHKVDKLWWDRVVIDSNDLGAVIAVNPSKESGTALAVSSSKEPTGELAVSFLKEPTCQFTITTSKKSSEELALTTDQFKELVLTAQHLHKKYRRFVVETTVRDSGNNFTDGSVQWSDAIAGKIQLGTGKNDSINGDNRVADNKIHRSYKKIHRIRRKSMVSTARALQAEKCSGNDCYICSAGGNLIVVLANGDVMPCRRLPFVIGNVKEKSLSDIINGSRLMKNLSTPRYPDGCSGCKRFDFCRGGARCVTYGQTGKLNAKDVNCFYH